jgi:putative ABC transport system permease protein
MNLFYMVRLFFRMLMRRKLFSSINIIGLAFGIAFILLIGQYLYFEFSYNRSFENIDHIYRLVDIADKYYGIDYRVRDAIVENIPAVKNASLLLNRRPIEVNHADQVYELGTISLVDPGFFEIFKFPFIYGEPQSALSTVEGVVLTESTARRIFGETDVLGQTLILEHEFEMVVTGVVRDLPQNTSFRADLFASAENTKSKRLSYAMDCLTYDGEDDSQCKYPYNIFVELQDNADPAAVAQQVPGLFSLDDYRFPDAVSLTPLKTNYFNTQYPDGDLAHGNLGLVKILSWIGLIILLLAVINFVNLTTAGYKYRLTEIGVKKCFGVSKRSLQKQLLFESFLICLCAALLAIFIAEVFLPYFNQYVDKPLHIQIFTNLNFTLLFVLFIVFLSVFAGLLPAVILAKISPLQVFQLGSYMQGSGKVYRHILSVFQFGVTIALICSLLVMSKQIDYVKHKDLGFDTEQLLSLKVHHRIGEKTQVLMDKLQQYHGMKSLTFTNGIPGKISMSMGGFKTIIVDSSTMKTFGFKIVQGRDLLPGDLNKACLINTAGLAKFEDSDFRGREVNGSEVVGVVSDFHYDSMYKKTEALALMYYDWGGGHITMRITGPVDEAMNYIRVTWKEICPDYPMELQFYDDAFAAMYRKEDRLATLITIFSVLAVVISCMGIFGLAVFQSEQRVKEIGVRKVLGATAAEIAAMLTKNFIKWVIIANLVAWPVAYYAMNKWLQNFAYRINMSWWMFALAGGTALVIALLTVSWQAIKAATANPVESLRYE